MKYYIIYREGAPVFVTTIFHFPDEKWQSIPLKHKTSELLSNILNGDTIVIHQ